MSNNLTPKQISTYGRDQRKEYIKKTLEPLEKVTIQATLKYNNLEWKVTDVQDATNSEHLLPIDKKYLTPTTPPQKPPKPPPTPTAGAEPLRVMQKMTPSPTHEGGRSKKKRTRQKTYFRKKRKSRRR